MCDSPLLINLKIVGHRRQRRREKIQRWGFWLSSNSSPCCIASGGVTKCFRSPLIGLMVLVLAVFPAQFRDLRNTHRTLLAIFLSLGSLPLVAQPLNPKNRSWLSHQLEDRFLRKFFIWNSPVTNPSQNDHLRARFNSPAIPTKSSG